MIQCMQEAYSAFSAGSLLSCAGLQLAQGNESTHALLAQPPLGVLQQLRCYSAMQLLLCAATDSAVAAALFTTGRWL